MLFQESLNWLNLCVEIRSRSRKFWHCDKDEVAIRLVFLYWPSLLFFVFGYLCSCLFATLSGSCCCRSCLNLAVMATCFRSLFSFSLWTAAFSLFAVATPKHEKSISKFMYTQIESALQKNEHRIQKEKQEK